MDVQKMKVAEIQFHPNNPRVMPEENREALGRSLEEFDQVVPLVWNKRTEFLLGGEKRLLVLRAKGVEEVWVNVVDVPEEKEKALMIALNSQTLQGRYTKDVRGVIEELESSEMGKGLVDAFRLNELLAEKGTKSAPSESRTQAAEDLSPRFNEKHNYVVFVFDDDIDFAHIQTALGMGLVKNRWTEKPRVGLGRVLDGKVLMDLLKERTT